MCEEPTVIKLQGLLSIKFYTLRTLALHYFAEAIQFFVTWWIRKRNFRKCSLELATVQKRFYRPKSWTQIIKMDVYYLNKKCYKWRNSAVYKILQPRNLVCWSHGLKSLPTCKSSVICLDMHITLWYLKIQMHYQAENAFNIYL